MLQNAYKTFMKNLKDQSIPFDFKALKFLSSSTSNDINSFYQ